MRLPNTLISALVLSGAACLLAAPGSASEARQGLSAGRAGMAALSVWRARSHSTSQLHREPRWFLGANPAQRPFARDRSIAFVPGDDPVRDSCVCDPMGSARRQIGIAYPPRPEPTVYLIEGGRQRPVTRVIRISDVESAGTMGRRFVHAETGALLLRVPRR